jgi:hypothetical protein
MPFSDDNLRTEENATYTQRLLVKPNWHVDGIATIGLSQNSEDENRSYYNPSSDLMGLAGVRLVQTLYQPYATIWQHSLELTPGVYWQSHYGSDAALRARYEHRIFLSESFEAGLGVNYRRQNYDGEAENDFSVTFDLIDHF